MTSRSENILTKTGQLKKTFKPAVYFDTSVLVDYWSAEGLEIEDRVTWPLDCEYEVFFRKFLNADKRISEVGQIRKAILIGRPDVFPVTSSLATLELIEWYASAVFKQGASEVAGAISIQRRSRKEIGDLLRQLTDLSQEERNQRPKQNLSTPLQTLSSGTWLNPSFAEAHGLQGIFVADLVNFSVTQGEVWSKACILAYLQVGMADVLHVLAASHLGCAYFASFDSDFRRVSDILLDSFGLKLLPSTKELLQIFTA